MNNHSMINMVATFALRPAVAFQPNSPSCGNQPAHISMTARRLDTPTKDKTPQGEEPGRSPRNQLGGRPTHAHLTNRLTYQLNHALSPRGPLMLFDLVDPVPAEAGDRARPDDRQSHRRSVGLAGQAMAARHASGPAMSPLVQVVCADVGMGRPVAWIAVPQHRLGSVRVSCLWGTVRVLVIQPVGNPTCRQFCRMSGSEAAVPVLSQLLR
jgi:hypothetical protein